MIQLPRNIFVGALAALATFVYVLAGYLMQVIHGTEVGVTFGELLMMAGGAAAIIGLAFWGLMAVLSGVVKADPGAKVRLRGAAGIVSAVVLVLMATGGATVGAFRAGAQDELAAAATAAKAAREARAASEAARFAALTPEQQAAETRAKELARQTAVANAKKAQEAVSAAAVAAEQQKMADSLRQALVLQALKGLRESMKDPDTFELKQVLLMQTGSGCFTYRAHNSFGAALQGHAVLSVSPAPKGGKATSTVRMYTEGQDGFGGAWNRSCANREGEDFTQTAKGVLGWD